jgi:hypothetical protein
MSLDDWARNGWIKPHRTSPQEIRQLLAAVRADLVDAAKDLSPDWRFVIAYNAALRLGSVLLAVSGYQAERSQKHYRTIAVLPLILGPELQDLSIYLDRCRVRRSAITYEAMGRVSESEAEELITEVEGLRHRVEAWLVAEYPDLIGG